MILISILLLIAGLVTFPLPFPIGLPLLIIGLALLVRHSSDAKRYIVRISRKYPKFHRLLSQRKRQKPMTKTAEERID
jgi:archaellum biogenesis protein FlaJ (TadC family)